MIEIKNLSKSFSTADGVVDALRDVSLTIRDGDIYGIIGMSGAGKSTLVRCINMLERPTEGSVIINGQDIGTLKPTALRDLRHSVSMIFQGFNLLMQRTCLKNICFPMELAGIKKADAVKRAKELLEIVGLPNKANAYPAQLSGGQKQRIAIAGIIAMRPKCVVLDEPTAMLDPKGRREVMETIKQLNKELGITVVIITHYMDEAAMCDRVVVVDDGKIIMDSNPREVFGSVEKIKERGLDVPQVTELCHELSKEGFDVPCCVLTEEECVEALEKLLKGGAQNG